METLPGWTDIRGDFKNLDEMAEYACELILCMKKNPPEGATNDIKNDFYQMINGDMDNLYDRGIISCMIRRYVGCYGTKYLPELIEWYSKLLNHPTQLKD